MNATDDTIERTRRFGRFYTKQIGLLSEGLLETPYTLPEGRVIFELARNDAAPSGAIADALGLDAGYLSRVLGALEERGLVSRTRSPDDRRRVLLSLTEDGHEALSTLNTAARARIRDLLSPLSDTDRARMAEAMGTIEAVLGHAESEPGPVVFRGHRPGDMGWVVQRHGEMYHELRGWDETFEVLVARIAADFLENFDPKHERSWIAERDGRRLGCVFLTRRSDTVGQLRMLIVEPHARGLGIGRRLVGECVSHARFVGYESMVLFTSQGLDSARRIYEAEGFQLVEEKPAEEWGKSHVEQWWELTL